MDIPKGTRLMPFVLTTEDRPGWPMHRGLLVDETMWAWWQSPNKWSRFEHAMDDAIEALEEHRRR